MLRPLAPADNAAMQIEPTKSDRPKRKRRWFQFSLRSLMVLMILVGIGMTWLVAIKHRAERQKAAVETIVKGGGSVDYDYQFRTLPSGVVRYIDDATPPGPTWLRSLLGDDFFTNVVSARIVNRTGLDQLAQLPQIQRLELDGATITDLNLDQLKELKLEALCLQDTGITDSGLDTITGLKRLKLLELRKNKITDDGLGRLAGLTQLEELDLSETNVTDAGLKRLLCLTQLVDLKLENTQITGVGLQVLGDMPQLHILRLNYSRLTDATATSLSRLSQLRTLELNGTQFTDAGLASLSGLNNLRMLGVMGTQVTDEGIAKLWQTLPHCFVYRKARNNPRFPVPEVQ